MRAGRVLLYSSGGHQIHLSFSMMCDVYVPSGFLGGLKPFVTQGVQPGATALEREKEREKDGEGGGRERERERAKETIRETGSFVLMNTHDQNDVKTIC